MTHKAFLLFSLAVAVSFGAEWHVDNVRGDDANDGSREKPFRTVAKALSSMQGGDSLHLVPNRVPYCERVTVTSALNGTPDRPTVIDGHGARFDGLFVPPASDWTDEGGGVWSRPLPNNAWPMDRIGHWCGAFPIVEFAGRQGVNCTNLTSLVPGGYFLFKAPPPGKGASRDPRHNTLYVRPPEGCAIGRDVAVFSDRAKFDFVRCRDAVIRNVSLSHTTWDCFATFGATNCVYESIDGSYAMDQGISSHSSVGIVVRDSRFHHNTGGGIVDVVVPRIPQCEVTYENCLIDGNLFRNPVEFYADDGRPGTSGRYRMSGCVIRGNETGDDIVASRGAEVTVRDCEYAGAAEIGFRIVLRPVDATNDQRNVVVSAADMRRRIETPSGIVWSGHSVAGEGFTVRAAFRPDVDGRRRYSFGWTGNRSGLGVCEVAFPEVTLRVPADARLLVPGSQGWLMPLDREKLKSGERLVRTSVRNVHLTALLAPGASYYIDQRGDARYHATRFEARGAGEDRVTVSAIWESPLDSAGRGELPFWGVMGRMRKDTWFAAAEVYRTWAKGLPQFAAARSRHANPLREVDFWMWNRGDSKTVLPPAERFAAETGCRVALDWYWWHRIPYDTDYPLFWPPREPEAEFRAAIRRATERGVFVQPYVNGMTATVDGGFWLQGGREGAIVRGNGRRELIVNHWNGSALASMCGEASRYQDFMSGLVKTLSGCGFSGVYLDMIGNAGIGGCYNPEHAHPQGGGRHLVDGMRRYVGRLRRENPKMIFTSEEGSEPYLDLFEAFITCSTVDERCGEDGSRGESVPLFNAVYHEVSAVFGGYPLIDGRPPWDENWPAEARWKNERFWPAEYPDQFAVEFLRGVSWGVQPGVHKLLAEHFDDPRLGDDLRLIRDVARFRKEHKAFLYDGEMRDPGVMTCARRDVRFLSRMTFTAEDKEKTLVHRDMPCVFHSVWKAPDGRLAAVLLNWTREPQRYMLKTPDVCTAGTIPPRGIVFSPKMCVQAHKTETDGK